jgi:site-specific recombinase
LSDSLFDLLENGDIEPVAAMTAIIAWLRPNGRNRDKIAPVLARMIELEQWLETHPQARTHLTETLNNWLMEASYFEVFTSLGILSRRGFSREFFDRLYEKFNPSPRDKSNIRDAIALVFNHNRDADWVCAIPTETWVNFLSALWHYDREQLKSVRYKVCSEVLYALEMLSIWIAAEELEAEILRLDPKIVSRDSAFVAQQRELARFVRHYEKWLDDEAEFYDDDHARVLLEQCREGLDQLRKRMMSRGASIALTHLLERLDQTLARIDLLLDTLTVRDREAFNEKAIELLKQLVTASNNRNSLSTLWRQNSRLLARSVTENASHQGEHYVTSNRREYLSMLWSGAGGGFIIAFMALIKIQILAQGFNAGMETLLSSLNYGLGFVLIHMVGCTVATKQPAMTAAHFANAVEKGDQGRANAVKLADLLIRVSRSQFIAIVGNVSIALSMAYLLAWAYSRWQGANLIDEGTADYLLHRLDFVDSLALVHAAIAGAWLFVSGLISGYFDNRAARLDLAGRLGAHPLLTRLLPGGARQKVAVYVGDNYGALIGNFAFGFLLGTTAYFGSMLGLPLDIRHVAFASTDFGYGISAVDVDAKQLLLYGGCVLLIGAVNLWASFSLALSVALRARDVRISSMPNLGRALWRQILRQPLALFFPPADEENTQKQTKDSAVKTKDLPQAEMKQHQEK